MTGAGQNPAPAAGGSGGSLGQLSVRRGGETLRAVALEMRSLSLGRTPDNGLPLVDPGVAIRHAELTRAGDQLTLTDLGGGATFLNGRPLQPHAPALLADGDEIQIGPFTLAYAARGAPDAPSAPAAAPADLASLLRVLVTGAALEATPRTPLPATKSSYTDFLPALFEDSPFVGRYLRIFENVWEPLQHRQDHLSMYFDPRTSPPEFLNWLSGWLGLEVDERWPEARRREWVLESITLYRWRGTRYGLKRALEIACGVTPALIEDPARPHHVRVVVPEPPGSPPESRALVEEIVAQHAPAHVAYTLEFVPFAPAGAGAGAP